MDKAFDLNFPDLANEIQWSPWSRIPTRDELELKFNLMDHPLKMAHHFSNLRAILIYRPK